MSESLDPNDLPGSFSDEEALEEFMSRPTEALIDDLYCLEGDIMVLGVGGKMGPTLARLAKRAAPQKTIIGVSRFTNSGTQEKLENWGIKTIKANLLDRRALAELPKIKNIIFMAGRKFGSSGSQELTWAMNVYCPALVAEVFRDHRIVAYSTACVYPFVEVTSGGAKENLPPNPPGEYAQSCVGRERMFQYFSRLHATPGCLIRLSYAIDLRYGVFFDVANAVFRGNDLDISTGYANVIWQGDANTHVLHALRHCATPAWPLNLSGSKAISIRWLAEEFGSIFDKAPKFVGSEADTAWLVNTENAQSLFGKPPVPTNKMIEWVADWIIRGGVNLEKPTQFESRNGAY